MASKKRASIQESEQDRLSREYLRAKTLMAYYHDTIRERGLYLYQYWYISCEVPERGKQSPGIRFWNPHRRAWDAVYSADLHVLPSPEAAQSWLKFAKDFSKKAKKGHRSFRIHRVTVHPRG